MVFVDCGFPDIIVGPEFGHQHMPQEKIMTSTFEIHGSLGGKDCWVGIQNDIMIRWQMKNNIIKKK